MDKTNTIAQFISTTIMSMILGLIAGVIWKFALNIELKPSLIYGGLIGAIIGLLFAFSNNSAIKSGKFKDKESSFASGGILFGLFFASAIVATIVGLIRWVF